MPASAATDSLFASTDTPPTASKLQGSDAQQIAGRVDFGGDGGGDMP